MYQKPDGKYEMVDGQQRSRTIYRFVHGQIKSSKDTGEKFFSECNTEEILKYRLPFIIIKNLLKGDSLNNFYVLINKKGKHLNTPELYKSEYFDTTFYKLSEKVLSYQGLINLDLFTDATSKRMNDRAYIEELLAYLKEGIKDKKSAVEQIYKENDLTKEESATIERQFEKIIDRINILNKISPINKTRYKQKNDFYTLFNFVNENIKTDTKLLEHQYQILLVLNGKDRNGIQFISPSNEECEALKEYALNCVTQSNSKKSRENRLTFFNSILKNRDLENNDLFEDVYNYLEDVFGEQNVRTIKISEYELLDPSTLKFD